MTLNELSPVKMGKRNLTIPSTKIMVEIYEDSSFNIRFKGIEFGDSSINTILHLVAEYPTERDFVLLNLDFFSKFLLDYPVALTCEKVALTCEKYDLLNFDLILL